ncbi:UBX domain-containing protein 10 [Salminus brasiliensis]|uniref:UBX domain-containing protein 10 n=1 Tax=Salminus brasiliensis TaxID=930266 RepID=UPI003B8390F3
MHMTRPKSSKGRTRARVTQALPVDEAVHQGHMFSPHPPPPPPSSTSTVVSSQTGLRRNIKPSPDVLTEVFAERPPDVPVLSLNKYKVLPSIEKRPEVEVLTRRMEEKASRLSLSDSSLRNHRIQREQHITRLCPRTASRSVSEMGLASEVQCGSTAAADTWRVTHGHSGSETSVDVAGDSHLLLAIRTPFGQRFECHFQPTDTLQAVIAAAEAKSGERYEHAVIETMEVPRQTFTDLTTSLSQCGIFNKSVLCISLEDSAMDSD